MREYLKAWIYRRLGVEALEFRIEFLELEWAEAHRKIQSLEAQTSIVSQLQKELEEVRAAQREIQDFRREVVEKSKVVRTRNSSEFRKLVEGN